MFYIGILAFFIVAVLLGVQSWPWKIILFVVFAATWYFYAPASIAVAVIVVIGIAFKNSLSKITSSKF